MIGGPRLTLGWREGHPVACHFMPVCPLGGQRDGCHEHEPNSQAGPHRACPRQLRGAKPDFPGFRTRRGASRGSSEAPCKKRGVPRKR
jgi:hypothetical protein